MKFLFLAFALSQFVGCAKFIDQVQDGYVTNAKSVRLAKIECYSANGKFFEYEHDGPIWENKNGGYRIIKMDKIITVNGDCVLTENY